MYTLMLLRDVVTHGIDAGKNRPEFVLLVSRGGETSVLRVKLN